MIEEKTSIKHFMCLVTKGFTFFLNAGLLCLISLHSDCFFKKRQDFCSLCLPGRFSYMLMGEEGN